MFIVHMITAKDPLFDRSMFKDRNFATAMVFMAVTGVLLLAGLAVSLVAYSAMKRWLYSGERKKPSINWMKLPPCSR